jgi:hypothetical protein
MTDQDWWRQQVEQQLADLPNSARGPDAQKFSRLDHPGATSTAPEKFRAGVCDRPAAQTLGTILTWPRAPSLAAQPLAEDFGMGWRG